MNGGSRMKVMQHFLIKDAGGRDGIQQVTQTTNGKYFIKKGHHTFEEITETEFQKGFNAMHGE